MAESIVTDLIGRLLGYMGQSAVEKVATYFGGRDKLKEIQQTMMMIQARLSDAERLREGEEGALVKLWLKRLKNVLYRLEDLFEEVALADKEMEQMAANNLAKVVCFPISQLSLLKMNDRVAKQVVSVMRELEGITSDMHKLHLRVHSNEGHRSFDVMSSRETHSFVLEEEIIGRDENKNEIVKMLLDSDHSGESLSVIPVVGIGGLGKTTLAQLVYNDNIVQQHFELKCWVCISEISSFEELAGKILKSLHGDNCDGVLRVEQLQSQLREAVNDKKYLLVLDDVWDEDRERWLCLRRLLCCGKRGSKILVTTRSKVVAVNMGTVAPYELKGLSEEKSWVLFRCLAFREGEEERNQNLTSIGREIVKKCANVPLAIRTVAGILYSKDTEEEWMQFKDSDLRMMELKENSIMSTLKLSYDHLPPQLKQCFAYCSLFPKDHEFDKQKLIWLWMSQGFIEPLGNQSLDDIAHTYFLELWRRCFFQDVRRNFYGRITRCKMHDLMHDLALKMGDECLLVERNLDHVNENIRHINFMFEGSRWKPPSWLQVGPRIRSVFLYTIWVDICSTSSIIKIFPCLKLLRALDLGEGFYDSLPNRIGELKHLRYLRVRISSFYLPVGITRLQNLQTLDISRSRNLKKLPSGFNKLSSLRHLQTRCSLRQVNGSIHVDGGELVDMPRQFGKLTCLVSLDKYIVGKNNGLDALANLNLAGGFQIFFRNHRQNMKTEAMLANLKEKKLAYLLLNWTFLHDEESDTEANEVLQCLQPPSTLKAFTIQEWKGERFPSWGIDQNPCLLPNLVSISIEGCSKCRYLPSFSQLPHLKMLDLRVLHALECIDTGTDNGNLAAAYFPALEKLYLHDMPKLKRWLSVEYAGIDPQIQYIQHSQHPFHPCHLKLWVSNCPKLMSLPLVSNLRSPGSEHVRAHELLQFPSCLEELSIIDCDELDIWSVKHSDDVRESQNSGFLKSLQYLKLDRLLKLESLPRSLKCATMLQQLHIRKLPNLKSLPEWIGNLSQLRELEVENCPKLTVLPQSFRNLTALEKLWITDCPKLKKRCEGPDSEDWPLIQHVLEVKFPVRLYS